MDRQFIQKAIVVNSLLIVYFCCTNLSSFFGIILGISMFATAGVVSFLCPTEKKLEVQNKLNQCVFDGNYVQQKFNQLLKASLGKQISTLITFYIITKISWYVPTWLLLIIIGQTYVCWNLLKENAIFDKVEHYIRLTKQSLEKTINLIPKYQAEANN